MRRSHLGAIALILCVAGAATAAPGASFTRAPLAPEFGVETLTRRVAREHVGRDVFSNPYATVTLSHVDLYDRFPYVESRNFQIVSDPRWNRLIAGEPGRSLTAFDGRATAFGALANPHGLAVDDRDRVYVADTGNDRVLVLQAVTEFDRIDLLPLFAIGGLSAPQDVAWSDGGTPFRPADDLLYVADSGRNRVVAFALHEKSGVQVAALGGLGSGHDRFAGPTAIATGRADGASSRDLYVADAHNRRIVRLRHDANGLIWAGEAREAAGILTSLDVDEWGNLYAAAPQDGRIFKLNAALEPVAELSADFERPRSFHVPFTNVRDHRDGTVRRSGQPVALSVDQWSDTRGIGRWQLGAAIEQLAVSGGDVPAARFVLTDRATVTLDVRDARDGRLIAQRSTAALDAGVHEVALPATDLAAVPRAGGLVLRVVVTSSYAGGGTDAAQVTFRAGAPGGPFAPARAALLGSWPNPAAGPTRISFLLPERRGRVTLGVFDPGGRRVRSLSGAFTSGFNELVWDGADDAGRAVRPGFYFARLDVDAVRSSHRMVVVR